MMTEHRVYMENLLAAHTAITVGEIRASIQSKFNLDRIQARQVVLEWLHHYPFKAVSDHTNTQA